jgi:hypothetical protein
MLVEAVEGVGFSFKVTKDPVQLDGLHPDLVPYVRHGHKFFGTMVDHPLVRVNNILPSDVYPEGFPSGIEQANSIFSWKRDVIAEAITTKDWGTYVSAHERPYRFNAVREIAIKGYATIHDIWPAIGGAWLDSNNIWQYADEWLALWRTPSDRKLEVMNTDDRAVWDKLPDDLTIYRGVNCDGEWNAVDAIQSGLSWTLDRSKALWFARRGSSTPWMARASIKRCDCFAYFGDCNESEIVINPERRGVYEYKKVRRSKR